MEINCVKSTPNLCCVEPQSLDYQLEKIIILLKITCSWFMIRLRFTLNFLLHASMHAVDVLTCSDDFFLVVVVGVILSLFLLHWAASWIVSCFHYDSSIRLWALTGETLMEMVGHTSIVYSVDSHASGLIVSGSEDCFAKIWKGFLLFLFVEFTLCLYSERLSVWYCLTFLVWAVN